MYRYKIIIEYVGTEFVGWQKQKQGLAIQNIIESSIEQFSGEIVAVCASGRTDAGVHAIAQVAHFDLPKQYPPQKIRAAINYYLKTYPIAILEVNEVDNSFHARFSAKQRGYLYKIINRAAPPKLQQQRAWHISKKLNISEMQQAANYLLGKHDFSSFRASQCQSLSTIRTIEAIAIVQTGSEINITIHAKSFLHNQVRIIVGTLAKVGRGEWNAAHVQQILIAKTRVSAGATAPAAGLYFLEAKY